MILFLIGLLSGVISGMGIGGGTLLIPGLILFTTLSQHQAQAINLFTFIPTASIALIIHWMNKSIDYKLAIPIIISGLIGAFFGSFLAVEISSALLRRLFSLFLFVMGFYQVYSKPKK